MSSVIFLNEIWFLGIQLFSNVPYWSLNYEVWYYVLFAVILYTKKGVKKFILLLAITLLIGPKILLLLPVWWMGVFAYRSPALNVMSTRQAWVLLILSLMGFYAYIAQNMGHLGWNVLQSILGNELHQKMGWSRQFFTDYFLGFFLMLHFAALRKLLARDLRISSHLEKPIRYFAGSTFSLYLFHQPLLWFFRALFNQFGEIQTVYVLALVFTFFTVLFLSGFTERKKGVWGRGFNALTVYTYSKLERFLAKYR